MNTKKITINLIQDLATPHNNVLIKYLTSCSYVRVNLWYARDQDVSQYQWTTNITHEHGPAKIYGTGFNWSFIKYCLTHPNERYVIVGWMNTNTRLLHLLFFLLRRTYNHWTDLPQSETESIGLKHRFVRWLAYKILEKSRSKVFGVGSTTLNYLRGLGFAESKLVNLPIFVESDEDLPAYHGQRGQISDKYSIKPDDFVLSAGSRIIHEKGYDLLIRAVALVDLEIRRNLKVVIVGTGVCVSGLEQLISELKLSHQIILEKWLAIDEFKALIANSDIFMHPARADTYGGTTLGMALGVPVIGSYGAGAAVDRIQHGCNGFLYEAEDTQSLADFITLLYQNEDLCKLMGQEALVTAKLWKPERGVQILFDHTI